MMISLGRKGRTIFQFMYINGNGYRMLYSGNSRSLVKQFTPSKIASAVIVFRMQELKVITDHVCLTVIREDCLE